MARTSAKIKLGALIRNGLQAVGLRQTDLAKYLQVSPSATCQMLSGQTAL